MTSSAKILYSATALLCALTLAGCGVSDADHSAQTDASPSASASVAQGKITRASDPAHSVSPGSISTAAGIVLKALRITPQIITTLTQTMNIPRMGLRKKTPILRILTIKRVHPARKAKMRMALHRITMEITALKNRPAQKLNSQGVQQPVLQVHS